MVHQSGDVNTTDTFIVTGEGKAFYPVIYLYQMKAYSVTELRVSRNLWILLIVLNINL